MRFASIGFLAFLLFAGLANASITPNLVGSPVTIGSNDYQYNYSITVNAGEQLGLGSNQNCTPGSSCGTFFRIYDFQGYIANTVAAPTGWGTTIELTGATPNSSSCCNPPDSSVVSNLVFMYSGLAQTANGVPITGFSAQSIYGTVSASSTGYYSYQVGGTVDNGMGRVAIPVAVPEPGTLTLIGCGLTGLAFLRRKLIA